ncbi:MmyB family transcriptional regulator [Streptomyces massasporeus]|uniref:MmyB family transcriptional regulator n=1 Tax=Streptomyces massasporeus TaxID=67324 RepID=UPI0033D98CE8
MVRTSRARPPSASGRVLLAVRATGTDALAARGPCAGPAGLAAWPVLQDGDALNPALVADLRTALVDHPRDRGLTDLVEELRSTSAEFARLWDEGAVGPHVSARKTVVHPEVGEVTCD